MAPERSPAFQFYPSDFLSDEHVRLMCHTERGVYITLLCMCWLHGSLPADLTELATLVVMPPQRFQKLWLNQLTKCFVLNSGDGRLHQKRLDKERDKQETHRQRESDRGKAGADARWNGNGASMRSGMPQASSSNAVSIPAGMLSDSSSSSSSKKKDPTDLSGPAKKPPDPRVRSFLEWFQAEYVRRRQGAAYLVAWDKHPALVKRMLGAVDEPQLRRLAQMLLSSHCNEPFIEETDRGIGILSTKFNWLSDRLAAWDAAHPRTSEVAS